VENGHLNHRLLDESDGQWTQSIRRRFIEICPEGCYALPDYPWTAKGEFLVDVTWAEEHNGQRILLACESEWGTSWYGKVRWSRVEEDFEKLLPIKAPFKVLIFSSDSKLAESKSTVEGGLFIWICEGETQNISEELRAPPGRRSLYLDRFPKNPR
jgi:hypothetical protein